MKRQLTLIALMSCFAACESHTGTLVPIGRAVVSDGPARNQPPTLKVRDAREAEQPGKCEVHEAELEEAFVPIAFGYPVWSAEYSAAIATEFPHSLSAYQTCIVDGSELARVHRCKQCGVVESQWSPMSRERRLALQHGLKLEMLEFKLSRKQSNQASYRVRMVNHNSEPVRQSILMGRLEVQVWHVAEDASDRGSELNLKPIADEEQFQVRKLQVPRHPLQPGSDLVFEGTIQIPDRHRGPYAAVAAYNLLLDDVLLKASARRIDTNEQD